MKSPPPQTGPPEPETQQEPQSLSAAKAPVWSESEKDSGYSDSSSESVSSEEPAAGSAQGSASVQTAGASIYILQSVVLKQPHLLLLQPPLRRHRKRPAAHLPILRSYPRIAPRLAPHPTPSPAPSLAPPTAPTHRASAPQLLEVSLRAFALLRRSRETQRSIRELRAHVRLYERALDGERGGWERLQRAMERSGGYRRTAAGQTPPPNAAVPPTGQSNPEQVMTSSEKPVTSENKATNSEKNSA